MMRYKTRLALLLIVSMIGLLCSGCSNRTPSAESSPSQEPDSGTASALGSLASFSATALDGSSFTQDDIAAKDATIINFWALTCGPCIAEMPDLAAFSATLPENVQLITVCLDGRGSEEATRKILEAAGFEGVTLLSGDGDLAELCTHLQYTPTTVVANGEGKLVGDPIVGGQKDLSGVYLAAVNRVLAYEGKDEIHLEGN